MGFVGCVDILLIGCWRSIVIGSQHYQPSGSNWSGGLCVCGKHTINFFHMVEVSVSAKQLKRHGLRILSIVLYEELKVLDFV